MLETLLQENQAVLSENPNHLGFEVFWIPVCSETALATASSWQGAEPTSGRNLLGL